MNNIDCVFFDLLAVLNGIGIFPHVFRENPFVRL